MNLPLINTFSPPFKKWSKRKPTYAEEMAHRNATREHLLEIKLGRIQIHSHLGAAKYMAWVGADNELGNFINRSLDNSSALKAWRREMPSQTPKEIAKYQKQFPSCDLSQVDLEIKSNGALLSEGQTLFHGGLWPSRRHDELQTERPLSVTFCPQVALRNAEHRGKAYENESLDLLVLRVKSPKTKVFCFRRAGTRMGHENEVLFSSGAVITQTARHLIRTDYPARKWNHEDKEIFIYVIEEEIS